MRVNDLAKNLGVTSETVRYYTRIGLLKPTRNTVNGYREYSADDQRRLRFCVRARQLGFSLKNIKEFLNTADAGNEPCEHVREIMEENLHSMEAALLEAQSLFRRMQDAVSAWDSLPQCASDSSTICRLIEGWDIEVQSRGSQQ